MLIKHGTVVGNGMEVMNNFSFSGQISGCYSNRNWQNKAFNDLSSTNMYKT